MMFYVILILGVVSAVLAFFYFERAAGGMVRAPVWIRKKTDRIIQTVKPVITWIRTAIARIRARLA